MDDGRPAITGPSDDGSSSVAYLTNDSVAYHFKPMDRSIDDSLIINRDCSLSYYSDDLRDDYLVSGRVTTEEQDPSPQHVSVTGEVSIRSLEGTRSFGTLRTPGIGVCRIVD